MGNSPIKVLQIIADFKKGGVQADVMYPTRILSQDDVVFDVMLFTDRVEFYEEEFSKYGNIYRIPIKRKSNKITRALALFTNYFYVKKKMKEFFSTHNEYDAVHARHVLYNAPCIVSAKKARIPVRIAHCHQNKPEKSFKDRFYVKFYYWCCSKVLNRCATHKFGVTKNAAEYMFGKNKGMVIKNPTVDLEKFNPKKYANEINENINLIMVGSYSTRKNQRFAAEILHELLKVKPDSKLTFIGYPRNEKEVYLPNLKTYVNESGMKDSVEFLPQDSDVALQLSKSTIMLIPSLQEGLPNVALEAQAMGVPCFVSTDVSEDCNCGICAFLPLDKGPKYWADEILRYIGKNGYGKHYVDMSSWDNKKVSELHLEYWRGKQM